MRYKTVIVQALIALGFIGLWLYRNIEQDRIEKYYLASVFIGLVQPVYPIESTDRNRMTGLVEIFQSNPDIPQEQQAKLQKLIDQLNSSLSAAGLQTTPEELVGSAIYGLLKVYRATTDPSIPDYSITWSVQVMLEKLVTQLGPPSLIWVDSSYRRLEGQPYPDVKIDGFPSDIPSSEHELRAMIESLIK